MSNRRAPVMLVDDRPTLHGLVIGDDDVLEILVGGDWAQVFLDKSADRYRRWVFRFIRSPEATILAVGIKARWSALPRAEQRQIVQFGRERLPRRRGRRKAQGPPG